jgi:hypothetical protein
MLTGVVAFACLFFSWFFVAGVAVLTATTAYDLIAGSSAELTLEELGAGVAFILLVVAVMRWTARSLLAGSRVRAIVACALIAVYAGVTTAAVLSGMIAFDRHLSIAFAVLCLAFTGLLVASFRDGRYWSGRK